MIGKDLIKGNKVFHNTFGIGIFEKYISNDKVLIRFSNFDLVTYREFLNEVI